MARLNRDKVVSAALELLDDVGIHGMSTRVLAQRLGIEQPALYWHFKSKAELLSAMADAAMRSHALQPLPQASQDWRVWFLDNFRSFRRTLLLHRDGALLHAGSRPRGDDFVRIQTKIEFLVAAGLNELDATTAMLAAGRFTLGSALEEQADQSQLGEPGMDHEVAFEGGCGLIVAGLMSTQR